MASRSNAADAVSAADARFEATLNSFRADLDVAQAVLSEQYNTNAAIPQLIAQFKALTLESLEEGRFRPVTENSIAGGGPGRTNELTSLRAENARLRNDLTEPKAREKTTTVEKRTQTNKDTSSELMALRLLTHTRWATTDSEIARQTERLQVDICNFTTMFFHTGVKIPNSCHPHFLYYLGAKDPVAKAAYDTLLQDVDIRSKIVQLFIWQILLLKVFRRFLWMDNSTREAQRIAAALDPGKWA
ncbi:hypothetical protein N0V82_008739 [Gnomoniopsis sp. IMI 355080]|nr:hypothetical protein N0V82_008739 [Gnomoniopsis sp. IMI 355080]